MNKIILGLVLLLVAMTGYLIYRPTDIQTDIQPDIQPGSVTQGNEYYATSTAPALTGFMSTVNPRLIKGGYGALGSVIVAKAGSPGGSMNFYDATTTDATKRSAGQATSSIILASIPTDLAAGTYVFDITFTRGLLMDWSGTIGTSTITYR